MTSRSSGPHRGQFSVPRACVERVPRACRGPLLLRGPLGANNAFMGLGDHPMRTPVYGGLLIVGAMLGATAVWQGGLPTWPRNVLLVVALIAALAGWR